MSNISPQTLVFSEEHMNFIFNYLNEMYAARLNSLETLVSRNEKALIALKKEIETLNNSLKSLLSLNNYKFRDDASISQNFSDFFHDFLQFSQQSPLKVGKTAGNREKSEEIRKTPSETRKYQAETRKTPGETRKTPAETRKTPAETRKTPENLRNLEENRKTPTNLKPALKFSKKQPSKPGEIAKKPREIAGFKLVSSKNVQKPREPARIAQFPAKNPSERSKTPVNTGKIAQKSSKTASTDTKSLQKPAKTEKIQRETLDFKKLLVKNSKNKERDASSASREKNYQKSTRSSVGKARVSKEIAKNDNYSSLIRSVNEVLNFPELETSRNCEKTEQLLEKSVENHENRENQAELIEEIEKHCENLNKLYEEAVTGGENNGKNASFEESLKKNTSLGKIIEKRDSSEMENSLFAKEKANYRIKINSDEETRENLAKTSGVFEENREITKISSENSPGNQEKRELLQRKTFDDEENFLDAEKEEILSGNHEENVEEIQENGEKLEQMQGKDGEIEQISEGNIEKPGNSDENLEEVKQFEQEEKNIANDYVEEEDDVL